jgi:Glycosyl transferase family 2
VNNNSVIVAVPVRDEAARIGLCLSALNQQMRPPDTVVPMLNNCTDETETIAHAMMPNLRFDLDVITCNLPPAEADAGHARRLAMDVAVQRAEPSGVLLTTDADAIVPPDWVIRNLYALRSGVDIVCGQAVIDPLEAKTIQPICTPTTPWSAACSRCWTISPGRWTPNRTIHRRAIPRHPAQVLPFRSGHSAGWGAFRPLRRVKTGPSCAPYG